jgi:hypothetical protein
MTSSTTLQDPSVPEIASTSSSSFNCNHNDCGGGGRRRRRRQIVVLLVGVTTVIMSVSTILTSGKKEYLRRMTTENRTHTDHKVDVGVDVRNESNTTKSILQQQHQQQPNRMKNMKKKPVQVFIMMGQSNMLGMGHVSGNGRTNTVEYVVKHKPHLYGQYGEYKMVNDQNSTKSKSSNFHWTALPNVRYVQAQGDVSKPMEEKIILNDWLSIQERKRIGPEIGIGFVMDEHIKTSSMHQQQQQQQRAQGQDVDSDDEDQDEDDGPRILLLKACTGNRALGWDLLPPGSDRFMFEGKFLFGVLKFVKLLYNMFCC